MQQELDLIKKKLYYRSLNRGCKETDLLLTKFAKQHLAGLNVAETELYEQFLAEDDGDIYRWFCELAALPQEYYPIAERLAVPCGF